MIFWFSFTFALKRIEVGLAIENAGVCVRLFVVCLLLLVVVVVVVVVVGCWLLLLLLVVCCCLLFVVCVELREWGVFRFGNPTSGGTVFLHVQKLFPRFPLLMNFLSHCVSLASTC